LPARLRLVARWRPVVTFGSWNSACRRRQGCLGRRARAML